MCTFFTLGPMTMERSYTIYMLADMADYAEMAYNNGRDKIKIY